MVDVAAARGFMAAHARVLEQRELAASFDNVPVDGAVDALLAYRNPDGGFGHGLEPDKRVPASQPLDVEVAFERLHALGADRPDVVRAACDWLATVAGESGAVPIVLPSIDGCPRAAHWSAVEYPPHLNPTAAIAGYGHALGVSHLWLERATEYSLTELEREIPTEAHALLAASRLIEHADDERCAAIGAAIADAIPDASFMNYRPDPDGYGVTPLQLAPSPDMSTRSWFDDSLIDQHLALLAGQQQVDGGWPIAWESASTASNLEWRGIVTLKALTTLRAYGRLD